MLKRRSYARRIIHVCLTFPNGKQWEHPECSSLSGGQQKSKKPTPGHAMGAAQQKALTITHDCPAPRGSFPCATAAGTRPPPSQHLERKEKNRIRPGVGAQLPTTWHSHEGAMCSPCRVLSRTSVSPRGHHPAVRAPPPGRCDSSIRSLLSSLPHLPPSL